MRAAFPTLLCHFVRDRRGNIAVIFALACVPLITVVGCAVDYSRATQIRSKLQAAADAASVGSIAKASPAFAAAGTMTSDGSIAVGVTDAQNIFNANVANLTGYTPGTVTPTVVKSGSTVTSTVTFSATVNTMRREVRASIPAVVARLDRATRYAAASAMCDCAAAHSAVVPANAGIHTAESIEGAQSSYRARKRNY